MKRAICLLLALTMLVSLSACGESKEEQAFNQAKEIYDELKAICGQDLENLFLDVATAVDLGLDAKTDPIVSYADQFTLSREELLAGVDAFFANQDAADPGKIQREFFELSMLLAYKQLYNSTHSVYVTTVLWAYLENGTIEEIYSKLEKVKTGLEELEKANVEESNYVDLNEYYSTAYSLFKKVVFTVFDATDGSRWPAGMTLSFTVTSDDARFYSDGLVKLQEIGANLEPVFSEISTEND